MNLQEYQSKRIFAKYGVPIPRGEVATTATAARDIARRLGARVVIKSQVLVGGRGKAGGIKLANTPDEAEMVADKILGMDIKGLKVRKVLVDEAADIKKELYLGLVIDRAQRRVDDVLRDGGADLRLLVVRHRVRESVTTWPKRVWSQAVGACPAPPALSRRRSAPPPG